MAIKYVNGSGRPQFKIYNSSNALVETITLPLTDVDGLIESWYEKSIRHELSSYEILNETIGYRGEFDLSYKTYSTKETALLIQTLLQYQKDGFTIIFIPRVDVHTRTFEILYIGDTIEIGILKGGLNAKGNRLIHLRFVTKVLQESPNWTDPEDIQYAGFYQDSNF